MKTSFLYSYTTFIAAPRTLSMLAFFQSVDKDFNLEYFFEEK